MNKAAFQINLLNFMAFHFDLRRHFVFRYEFIRQKLLINI